METKSKQCALVGYDNGSKLVKYYTTKTQSVLTSRNLHFLKPSDTVSEQLLITPNNVVHKGESIDDA